ncbi:MAG TPA: class I SAM-dependent methyltransferase [Actinophytocola sp.]|uniref:class I SAM-dependent methyltransferase n=1 Tax=Actinophytocola sp. TaxID=1872138 RepID=UPI002DB92D85|nr:class I SAM-dependent methyltransferase [Actinophytocola sp.]HEU5473186.1 class I SAM-dependent methyltransferase [Actinophytocola sp.]
MGIQELRSVWESMGETDPLWAVLTDATKRNGRWDVDEFMATGAGDVGWITERLAEAGLTLGKRVLDFGCGVGRLSNALAEHAPEVVGIDIAASMIEAAKKINRRPGQVEFVHYDGHELPFQDASFDSAISMIVLQHAPLPVQLGCLLELVRVIRPGGILALQIPSEQRAEVTQTRPEAPPQLAESAWRAGIEILTAPAAMLPRQRGTVRARVTNLSAEVWPKELELRLGNHWLAGGEVAVQDDGRTTLPNDVRPGEAIEVPLPVMAPETAGEYELELDVVQEFVAWWGGVSGLTARTPVLVREGSYLPVAAAEAEPVEIVDSIEMHPIHRDLVTRLFERCGCEVVRAIEDDRAGSSWVSYTYLVRRRS